MGHRRTKLSEILHQFTDNVYFTAPSNIEMHYPAIRYKLDSIDTTYADNVKYIEMDRYQLILIDYSPESPIMYELLGAFDYIELDRAPYSKDGLYHFVFSLYF